MVNGPLRTTDMRYTLAFLLILSALGAAQSSPPPKNGDIHFARLQLQHVEWGAMITVLQRVCWNDKAWKAPSGKTFDSGNPGKHGFGNEEWNFCTDDAFDGHVFGWLSWRAKGLGGKHFQILFWTIPPSGKEWLIVGAYRDATLATDKELRKLHTHFKQNGIYKRRTLEATNVVEGSSRKRYVKTHPPTAATDLRFKCPINEVEIFQPFRVLPQRLQGKKVSARFKNPMLFHKPIATSFRNTNRSDTHLQCTLSPLIEDVYPRATPASLKMIVPRHKELCNRFTAWLKTKGFKIVGREKDRVDVEFRHGKHLCRAELKACYGMTTTLAIREALGQLLEYNHYGWRTPADRWFIVLDSEPSGVDVNYLRALTSKHFLPLSLVWKSRDEFEEIPLSNR